jgi:cytokinin riboside 5'-monophosphate phosphoribohydrolase
MGNSKIQAPRTVCVFCSSSSAVGRVHDETARQLGRAIASTGRALLYGGTNVGLMGALASSAREAGGRVIGVIPQPFIDRGIADMQCDELIPTRDLRERKAIMEQRSDAFIALPGGFGTLEELLEMLTLKQLGFHEKPIVLLDVEDFWASQIEFFEKLYRERFAKAEYRDMYHVAVNVAGAMDYLENYKPTPRPPKWFGGAKK